MFPHQNVFIDEKTDDDNNNDSDDVDNIDGDGNDNDNGDFDAMTLIPICFIFSA